MLKEDLTDKNYVRCMDCKWLFDLEPTLSEPTHRMGCLRGKWHSTDEHQDTSEIDWEHFCPEFNSVV